MDPISITIEVGMVIGAVVGMVATWSHNRHKKIERRDAERRHRETMKAAEQRHMELLGKAALPKDDDKDELYNSRVPEEQTS